MASHRTRLWGGVVTGRCRGLLLERRRRPGQARHRDHLLPDRRQRRFLADDHQHRHGAVFRRPTQTRGERRGKPAVTRQPGIAAQPRRNRPRQRRSGVQPAIRMNYYADPHDMKVMVAAIRRTIEIAARWPGNRKLGPLMMPPFLAEKHGYQEDEEPSDALLEDFALHYSLTVYHPTSTCRIGDVVDPRLRV